MGKENSSDRWMLRCLELAEEARAHGEAAVGAVVVRQEELLAEAAEQIKTSHDVTGHAELAAIRRACQALETLDLADCTLYTNVEPCWMCAFAIRETGIAKVVIAAPVADIGGATSRYPILTDPNIAGWPPPPRLIWEPRDEER